MSDAFELEICQGKYRYRYEAGKQEVWRNGYIWQTLNGKLIGDKFVFSLAVELDEALKECGELRAKIEAMEQQEPVAWMLNCQTLGGDTGWILSWTQSGAGLCNRLSGEENEKKLYALPGAKGE